MALSHLFNRGASFDWSMEHHIDRYSEHIDVDLRNVRLKNVTVTVEDNGTELRVKNKIKELAAVKETLKSYSGDRVLIQAQIDVLTEVLSG